MGRKIAGNETDEEEREEQFAETKRETYDSDPYGFATPRSLPFASQRVDEPLSRAEPVENILVSSEPRPTHPLREDDLNMTEHGFGSMAPAVNEEDKQVLWVIRILVYGLDFPPQHVQLIEEQKQEIENLQKEKEDLAAELGDTQDHLRRAEDEITALKEELSR